VGGFVAGLRSQSTILAVVVALMAGCGGGDEQTDEPPAARTTTAPADEIFHTVANDLRDIAALTVGECANEDAIRRGMDRLEEDAAELPQDLAQSAKAHKLVDEVLADAEDVLRSCP
jgi:hypothetical protein